jgi:hypothetical protein
MQHSARKKLVITLLALTVLACQGAQDLMATATPFPSPTTTLTPTITTTPTRTPTPTVTPLVIQGEKVLKVTSGGFSFAPLKGFDLEKDNYQVYMESPDGKIFVRLMAEGPFPGELLGSTVEHMMDYMVEQYSDVVETSRDRVELNGIKGISVLFSNEDSHEPFISRITVFQPPDGKLLYLEVNASSKTLWESYGEQLYQTVTKDLTFFEIKPWAGCPISRSKDYGYKPDKPIKVGGEFLDGPQREREYINALLGPGGEVVSFYRKGSENKGSDILDVYVIFFGGQKRILFLDMYHYEKPEAPFGMTCSGPFSAE